MPTIKLTEKAVAKLKAPTASGKQELHWDTETRGFAVLLSGVSNTRTYVVQAAVKGRTRRVTVGRVDLLKLEAARKKAEQELAKLVLGTDPKATGSGSVTLAEALKGYLNARKTNLSNNTIQSYNNLVNKHLKAWLNKPLSDITRQLVIDRYGELADEVGPATANGAARVLRLIWNFVLEEQKPEDQSKLGPNPVRLKGRWIKVAARKRLVKSEQMAAFYQAVCALPNPVHRDYLLTLLFTGMRRRECARLKWDYIDFPAKIMRLPEEITKTDELELPLTDFLFDLLVARRAQGNADGWVFPSNSKSGYLQEPKFCLAQVEKATGIKVSPHDLRRTFVTTAASCIIPTLMQVVLVNHSPGKNVHGDYVIPSVAELREPAQIIANRLKQLCGIKDVTGNVARLR